MFDEQRANKVCSLIERFPHEKLELQGQPVRLQPWQSFILCSIFGWVDKRTSLRRFREAFILVPRGNGKSPLAAWIALWMAFFDGEGGAEVYCGASTEKQALEVFRPAKAIVEMVEPLRKRFGIAANAKSLVQQSSRSRFWPVIGKPGDGAAPHCGIADEMHEHLDSTLYDCFRTGMVKRNQPLLLVISTAGATIEGPCYQRQKDVEAVLAKVTDNERLFGVIYQSDPEVDWTSEEALIMANPNWGISVKIETLLADQNEARLNSSKQNIFRCKHLNHWMTSTTSWMNMEAWSKCKEDIREEDCLNMDCWLGSDLASQIDLCATVKLFRKDIAGQKHYYAFARCYLPKERAMMPGKQHYQKWVYDGFLIPSGNNAIFYRDLVDDTVRDVRKYKIAELVCDERYARHYSQEVALQTDIIPVVITPASPLLSPAMKEVEAAVMDGRFHHDGHPILTWAMSNVMVRETMLGNLGMPGKQTPENKIDPAVALFMPMVRAMQSDVVTSVYDTEGIFVL